MSTQQPYPLFWPKPNGNTNQLQTRITERQKLDLYNRRVTTRDLAKILDVHERYLSYMFPFKVEVIDKSKLCEARRAFKTHIASLVILKQFTIKEAAKKAYVSESTMQRFVKKVRDAV